MNAFRFYTFTDLNLFHMLCKILFQCGYLSLKGGVGCSSDCRCEGCKNKFGTNGSDSEYHLFSVPILFMVLMLHYYWIFFGSVEEKHLKCLMEGCSILLFIIGILLHGDPDC